MFLINSRLGHFTATTSCSCRKGIHNNVALLLPKLRSYFAEFLNEGYLARLGILSLSTCVGFSTVTFFLTRSFSRQRGVNDFALSARHHTSGLTKKRIYQSLLPTYLHRNPISGSLSLLRHSIVQTKKGSTGILTCCPSATPFGLTLGTTNPGRTNLPQETLDFRRIRFSLIFSLLVPAFSLPFRPPILPD